jgi:poly [ADP-ribose] polymerase 2/3/4
MEIAQKLIEGKVNGHEEDTNPLDARFRSLNLESMVPVMNESKEFSALAAYAKTTHGSTHSHYSVQIEHAFRVKRSGCLFEIDISKADLTTLQKTRGPEVGGCWIQ